VSDGHDRVGDGDGQRGDAWQKTGVLEVRIGSRRTLNSSMWRFEPPRRERPRALSLRWCNRKEKEAHGENRKHETTIPHFPSCEFPFPLALPERPRPRRDARGLRKLNELAARPKNIFHSLAAHSHRCTSRHLSLESRRKVEMAGILAGAFPRSDTTPKVVQVLQSCPTRGGANATPPSLVSPQDAPSSPRVASTDASLHPPRFLAVAADRGAMMMKIYHASGIALAGTSTGPQHLSPSKPDLPRGTFETIFSKYSSKNVNPSNPSNPSNPLNRPSGPD
jgi:hypothetical protein